MGGKKTCKTETLVGCTWAELVLHLNKNDLGLKLNDPGVDIDHIRPVNSFTLFDSPVEQRACTNFNNLQLLTKIENIRKGDKYDAAAYAASAPGKAIAILRKGWEVEFGAGECEVFEEDSDLEYDDEMEMEEDEMEEYEMEEEEMDGERECEWEICN